MSVNLPEKLKSFEPYEPETGGCEVLLNANESFMAMPDDLLEGVSDELMALAFNRYPDPAALKVCALAKKYYGYTGEIVAGNGSDELIGLLMCALAQPGKCVVVSDPDFSMYPFYAKLHGLACVSIEKKDGYIDIDGMIAAARASDPALVIFSNPCNPTGTGVKREEILRLIRSVPCAVAVDEAYMDFWDQSVLNSLDGIDNAVVFRTLSKAAGLAGIRLGFAMGSPALVRALGTVKSPYNLNALTQAVGRQVLARPGFIKSSVRDILASRDELRAGLCAIGSRHPGALSFYDTMTNFVFVRLPDAGLVYEALKARGVLVRHIGDCLRITAGSEYENGRLLEALEDSLEEGA